MPIDRTRFLTIAMSLALGGASGCGPKAAPADPNGAGTGSATNTTDPVDETGTSGVGGSTEPAQECASWDANGECAEWAPDEGMYPAQECIDWDASDECIQYETYPDD